MFKRRRAVAAKGSDLPFCSMCGQAIRLDAATGRCALGHRVATPTPVPVASASELTEAAPLEDHSDPTAYDHLASFDQEATSGYDLSDSPGFASESEGVTWDQLPAPDSEPALAGALDEFLAWDEPSGASSALDVNTDELPMAPEAPVEEPALVAPLASDLLDELDDTGSARHRAVGTIGATIAVSGAVFGAIAVLPF